VQGREILAASFPNMLVQNLCEASKLGCNSFGLDIGLALTCSIYIYGQIELSIW